MNNVSLIRNGFIVERVKLGRHYNPDSSASKRTKGQALCIQASSDTHETRDPWPKLLHDYPEATWKKGNRGVWEYVNASCIVDEIIFLAILSHPFEGKIVFFRRRKDGEKKRK